jgi:hypothetical protein
MHKGKISVLKQDITQLRNMEKYAFDTLIKPQYTTGTLPYFTFKKLTFKEGMSKEEVVEMLKSLDRNFYETEGLRPPMLKTTCLYEKYSYSPGSKDDSLETGWSINFYFCPSGNGLKSYELNLVNFTIKDLHTEIVKAFLKEYGIPFISVSEKEGKTKFTWDKAGPFVFNYIDFSKISVETGDTIYKTDGCNIHFVF